MNLNHQSSNPPLASALSDSPPGEQVLGNFDCVRQVPDSIKLGRQYGSSIRLNPKLVRADNFLLVLNCTE